MAIDNKFKSIFNCELCDNKPCLIGCPLDNDIPEFIKHISKEDYEGAYRVFSNTTVLMGICGRICPHYKQCEGSCVKRKTNNRVKIGKLETAISNMATLNDWKIEVPKKTKYNVAVIGSGPSGLTCAAFLRKNGIGVTIYERHNYLGGLLRHGIPDFRLPKNVVDKTIQNIIDMGIDVKYNMELGKNLKLDKLLNEYDAIFLGIGANKSNKMHIEGEKLENVLGGNELLEFGNVDFKDKNVYVIGGGDVSLDTSRTIKRLGAKKVIVLYRKSEEEMSASVKDVLKAKKEGIEFIFNTNVIKILGNEKVKEIEVVKTESVIENDEKTLKDILNSNYRIKCDYVVMTIGSHPDKIIKKMHLELNDKGRILIDKNGLTSCEKIFAGGDVAGVKSTVAWAARSGRNSALAIIEYLKNCK